MSTYTKDMKDAMDKVRGLSEKELIEKSQWVIRKLEEIDEERDRIATLGRACDEQLIKKSK